MGETGGTSEAQGTSPESVWTEERLVGYAAVLRAMISAENELINNRVGWLAAIQGLLFAALGFAWKEGSGNTLILNKTLVLVFCCLGIAVCPAIASAIIGATRAQGALNEKWHEYKKQYNESKVTEYQGPDVMGLEPSGKKWSPYFAPPGLLAIAFTLAWLEVISIALGRSYWWNVCFYIAVGLVVLIAFDGMITSTLRPENKYVHLRNRIKDKFLRNRIRTIRSTKTADAKETDLAVLKQQMHDLTARVAVLEKGVVPALEETNSG